MAKVKRRDRPDTTLWSKHVASVLVYADCYEEARCKANQATMTSNLESDEDESHIQRKRRPPARYQRALASDDDVDVPTTQKIPRIAGRPTCEERPSAPRTCIPSTSIFTPRTEFFSDRTGQTEPCLVPQQSDSFDDVMLNPCQSTHELDDLCIKLKDQEYKKKVVHYLSLLGSKTPGDAVRRVLRTIATNNVWAQYSMKGRKGKKRLEDLEICSVIIQACHKMHPKESTKVFCDCTADTLNYAPHRGTRVENEMTEDGCAQVVQSTNRLKL